jgi:hypothetical protein
MSLGFSAFAAGDAMTEIVLGILLLTVIVLCLR